MHDQARPRTRECFGTTAAIDAHRRLTLQLPKGLAGVTTQYPAADSYSHRYLNRPHHSDFGVVHPRACRVMSLCTGYGRVSTTRLDGRSCRQ